MKKVENYSLNELLNKIFGFDSFKGNQELIIKNLLDGKDTFVIMPTGGGKSMCYQLPALISEGTAIIVSPLITNESFITKMKAINNAKFWILSI